MVNLRHDAKCGYCGIWMTVGTKISMAFGVPWHLSCVLLYTQRRAALAASGR